MSSVAISHHDDGMTRPPTQQQLPQLLTVHQAARILAKSASTLYRWSSSGVNSQLFVRLPSTGPVPSVRIDPTALAAYIESGHGPGPGPAQQ